ncbi:MAG: PAS domain-containing protein [Oligoflexales bacterium]
MTSKSIHLCQLNANSEIDAQLIKSLSNFPVSTFVNQSEDLHQLLVDFHRVFKQHNAFFITNLSGKLVYANEKFCMLSKYTPDELTEKPMSEVIAVHQSEYFVGDLWRKISSNQVWHGKLKSRTKDGIDYWVQASIYPLYDDQSSVIGYLAINKDVTNEVELGDKTKCLTEQLEEKIKN